MLIKRYQPIFGETRSRAGLDNITDDLILADAVSAHKEDPDSKDDPLPRHLREDGETEIAVDPKAAAAGTEDDDAAKGDENGKDGKVADKSGADADDYEPYIPEDPKGDADPDDQGKKPDPAKPAKPEASGDDDIDPEAKAFVEQLKKDGFDEDTVKMMSQALEVGGKIALNKLKAARAADEAEADVAKQNADKEFQVRRTKEFQQIGNFQKDGKLPKVPVETQKKLAEGKPLTTAEAELPGVKRQLAVWGHMTTHNTKVRSGEESYYITNFAQALDHLEATELRAGKAAAAEKDDKVRAKKATIVKGGNGAAAGNKGSKPAYVRGQGLEAAAQELMAEYQNV